MRYFGPPQVYRYDYNTEHVTEVGKEKAGGLLKLRVHGVPGKFPCRQPPAPIPYPPSVGASSACLHAHGVDDVRSREERRPKRAIGGEAEEERPRRDEEEDWRRIRGSRRGGGGGGGGGGGEGEEEEEEGEEEEEVWEGRGGAGRVWSD